MTPTITTDPTDVTTTETINGSSSVPTTRPERSDIENIGIEFEYPTTDDPQEVPAVSALGSRELYEHENYNRDSGYSSSWSTRGGIRADNPLGLAGRDHTGAEIGSPVLDLHSNEPEQWYVDSINVAESMGLPFAACGYGETNFGLHFHIDILTSEEWEQLTAAVSQEWAIPFFCASVRPNNPSPWRHGGVRGQTFSNPSRSPGREDARGPSGHYEFRLPEPGLPDHVSMMFHYFRLFAHSGIEAANSFARERVLDADPRLTPVQQYRAFAESDTCRNFPNAGIENIRDDTVRENARWFAREVMGDDV